MNLFRLVYVSEATQELSRSEVIEICEKSQINNHLKEITGMLVYENGAFLQLLEGRQVDVEATYEKIQTDPRHRACKILEKSSGVAREFANWSMRLVIIADEPKLIGRLGENYVFAPHILTANEAMRLLKILRNTSAI